MTGWRIGYAGGSQELIGAMTKLQSQSTSNACSIAQEAAREALEGPQDFLKHRQEAFKERRDAVVAAINAMPGLSCTAPEGAFYVYVGCAGLIGKRTLEGEILETDSQVCAYFLHQAEVAVVPGSAFGFSPYFRLSYATDLATLEQACTRLKKAIEGLG